MAALALPASVAVAAPGVSHETRRMVVLHRSWFPLEPEVADALRLVVQAGSPGDRMGLLEYGDGRVVRLASTSLGLRSAVRGFNRAVAGGPRTGPGDQFAPAILAALHALGPRLEGTLDLVWLVPPADGQAGSEAVSAAIAAARHRGAQVHVLAPTGGPIPAPMARVAVETEGTAYSRPSDQPLYLAMLGLIARSHDADRLPVRAGAFWVDDQAESLLIALDRGPDEDPELVGPDEIVRTPGRPFDLRWHRFSTYDLVEVDHPRKGLWRLNQPEGLDRAEVVLRRSPLRLILEVDPQPATMNAPVQLKVRFEENGRPLVSFARLKDMEVTVRVLPPEGEAKSIALERVPEGWYAGVLTPEQSGPHRVHVQAESPDVVRQHPFEFEVERQCFDVETRWATDEIAVDAKIRSYCGDLSDVRVRARFDQHVEGQEPIPGDWLALTLQRPDLLSAVIPREGTGELIVEAKAIDGRTPRRFALPVITPAEGEGSTSFGAWAARLMIANIPLLLLPLLWAHRRQIYNLEVAPHV